MLTEAFEEFDRAGCGVLGAAEATRLVGRMVGAESGGAPLMNPQQINEAVAEVMAYSQLLKDRADACAMLAQRQPRRGEVSLAGLRFWATGGGDAIARATSDLVADAPAVAARGPRGVGPRVGDFSQMFSVIQPLVELYRGCMVVLKVS